MMVSEWLAKWKSVEWIILAVWFVVSLALMVFAAPLSNLIIFGVDTGTYSAALLYRVQSIILASGVLIAASTTGIAFLRYWRQQSNKGVTKEMVTDLMLSREQFRQLYENSPVPYFLMDDTGVIRNPNRATLRFLGGTAEQCSATNFFSLLREGDDGGSETSLMRTKVERGFPITKQEVNITTLTGTDRWGLVSIYSLDKDSQIPYKHLVTLIDVTQEKESDMVKTDFLLLASHQLRTPLTTIKWYIDYLLTTKTLQVTDDMREYLEQIYVGNERMIELITTLLTVSRIEMGTLAPEYKRLHVKKLIEDILTELAPEILKKSINIEKTINKDDTLTTDRTMLRIAIHNLCTNAIKYSPVGATVSIDGVFTPSRATITVRDTGYGIPPAEQTKIFTKMFRASNARQVSANGTGLGLYLTKAFIEKLGGTMEFTSILDEGTTFTIDLPRVAPGA